VLAADKGRADALLREVEMVDGGLTAEVMRNLCLKRCKDTVTTQTK
jgi:hypothetical protein